MYVMVIFSFLLPSSPFVAETSALASHTGAHEAAGNKHSDKEAKPACAVPASTAASRTGPPN
jgi:hypothetical protein